MQRLLSRKPALLREKSKYETKRPDRECPVRLFFADGEGEVNCPWSLGIHIIYSDRIAAKYINAKKEIFVLSVTETYKHPSGF